MTAWTTERAFALRDQLTAAVGKSDSFQFTSSFRESKDGTGYKYQFEFVICHNDEGHSATTFSVSNATGYWGPHASHWLEASVKRRASRMLEGDWCYATVCRVFKDGLDEDAPVDEVAKLLVEAWRATNDEYPQVYAARARETQEKERKRKARKPSELSHSEFLNSKNAVPVVENGKIVSLDFYEDGDFDNPLEPSPEDYELLGLDTSDLGSVEPHPEGADRGGYVPTLSNGCYYSEASCEWEG